MWHNDCVLRITGDKSLILLIKGTPSCTDRVLVVKYIARKPNTLQQNYTHKSFQIKQIHVWLGVGVSFKRETLESIHPWLSPFSHFFVQKLSAFYNILSAGLPFGGVGAAEDRGGGSGSCPLFLFGVTNICVARILSGCTFCPQKCWRPFLVVALKRLSKWTTPTSRSSPSGKNVLKLTLALLGGASGVLGVQLTNFPCNLRIIFFSPLRWGACAPTARPGYAYGHQYSVYNTRCWDDGVELKGEECAYISGVNPSSVCRSSAAAEFLFPIELKHDRPVRCGQRWPDQLCYGRGAGRHDDGCWECWILACMLAAKVQWNAGGGRAALGRSMNCKVCLTGLYALFCSSD